MKHTITVGTSHFVSHAAAIRYYRPYMGDVRRFRQPQKIQTLASQGADVENRRVVDRKLKSGEIHIGRPALKPGETLCINREEGRYHPVMKVTKEEIRARIHGWDCVIPKGTPVTHQTACGVDPNYNFITQEMKWGPRITEGPPSLVGGIPGTWLHDMKYYGYNVPHELVEEVK